MLASLSVSSLIKFLGFNGLLTQDFGQLFIIPHLPSAFFHGYLCMYVNIEILCHKFGGGEEEPLE